MPKIVVSDGKKSLTFPVANPQAALRAVAQRIQSEFSVEVRMRLLQNWVNSGFRDVLVISVPKSSDLFISYKD